MSVTVFYEAKLHVKVRVVSDGPVSDADIRVGCRVTRGQCGCVMGLFSSSSPLCE